MRRRARSYTGALFERPVAWAHIDQGFLRSRLWRAATLLSNYSCSVHGVRLILLFCVPLPWCRRELDPVVQPVKAGCNPSCA